MASVDVQIVGFIEESYTTQDVLINQFTGFRCENPENPMGCYDYRVRFCCEGCCPLLNVSGDPELTDYYENYPGIYELITDDDFNGNSAGIRSKRPDNGFFSSPKFFLLTRFGLTISANHPVTHRNTG